MAKGGAFEREICKRLSLWWTEGKRDDIFYRTSASGARATQRRKVGKTTANEHGDMGYTDPSGKKLTERWVVEMKTGYAKRRTKTGRTQWCTLDILDGAENTPVLIDFWLQVTEEAEHTGREPVLVFRRNMKQACIAFRLVYFQQLLAHFGDCGRDHQRVHTIDHRLHSYDQNIVILNLSDFLEWIPDIRAALVIKQPKRDRK
jgi:hypothetical protein